MDFNWFGLGESETHARAPSTPSSPSANYADYGLAAVFAAAILWGLLGPKGKKSYHKEVRTKHVSHKRR